MQSKTLKVKLFSPPKWLVHMFQLVKKHQPMVSLVFTWNWFQGPGAFSRRSFSNFDVSFSLTDIRLFGHRRIKSCPLKTLELSCLETPWDDRWQIWTILSKSSRFKMMIYPEMVNEGKGGSCFRTLVTSVCFWQMVSLVRKIQLFFRGLLKATITSLEFQLLVSVWLFRYKEEKYKHFFGCIKKHLGYSYVR